MPICRLRCSVSVSAYTIESPYGSKLYASFEECNRRGKRERMGKGREKGEREREEGAKHTPTLVRFSGREFSSLQRGRRGRDEWRMG